MKRFLIFAILLGSLFIDNSFCLGKLSKQTSIQLSSNLKFAKNIEVGFQIMPYYSNYHIFRIAYSIDWLFEEYGSDNQFTSGFAIGTGSEFSIGKFKFDFLLNYLYQTGFDNRIRPANFKYETFYLSLDPKFEFSNFFITASGRYYINELKLDDKFENFSVSFGIGLIL